MTAVSRHQHRLAAARARVLPWLVALVFLLQMLAAGGHHHEPAAKAPHCVACAVHAQPHAGPLDLVVAPAPFAWRLQRILVAVRSATPQAFGADHLRPPPHAPPLVLFA